jgi:hypothetical protein
MHGLVKGLKLFTRLETNGLPGRNGNFRTRSRIATDTCFPRPDIEYSEASQLNAISFTERLFHRFKYSLYRHLCFGLCDAGSINNLIDNVELYQAPSAAAMIPWTPRGRRRNLNDKKEVSCLSIKVWESDAWQQALAFFARVIKGKMPDFSTNTKMRA